MRAILLFSGCILGLCLAATVHASTSVAAGSDGMGGSGSMGSSHSASNGNGGNGSVSSNDVAAALANLSHTSTPDAHSSSTSDPTTGSMIQGNDNDVPPPTHSHQVSLGWQSLLPGSIQ